VGNLTDRVVIGTRGSRLALIQTEWVAQKLAEYHPGLDVQIDIIRTAGDRHESAPFSRIGPTGIFVRDIESALADKRIDIAVHSLKDLQTELPPGLKIGAITERIGARDALLSRDGKKLDELPPSSVIGTSSARRRGILASEKPGFEIRECRGNIMTRIDKLKEGLFDAIILAEAGLIRLGLTQEISECLDVRRFVPAVGQGSLCIEINSDDDETAEIIEPLNHLPSYIACMEERRFLSGIGGGCHAPVGGHMYYENSRAVFAAFVGTSNGEWFARHEITEPEGEEQGIGKRMVDAIREFEGVDKFFKDLNRVG